jgi:hypothetical protein
VKGVAIYLEGGGDFTQQKAELRQGMDAFLKTLKEAARTKRLHWKIVCCGGRNQAHGAFCHAIHTEPDQLNILLVDSESPVQGLRIAHLVNRDGWNMTDIPEVVVNLMTQCMEAWIVADANALADFYGQHFNRNALPGRLNLEEEAKNDLYKALEAATRHTQKGTYGKIRHASKLLALIDPNKAQERCPGCRALFAWLGNILALT